jgi:hypothetical protein
MVRVRRARCALARISYGSAAIDVDSRQVETFEKFTKLEVDGSDEYGVWEDDGESGVSFGIVIYCWQVSYMSGVLWM